MTDFKILITDGLGENGQSVLRAAARVDDKTGISAAELVKTVGEYDALIVRGRTKVTAEVFEAGKRLKVVGRAGVGVDNIDLPAAKQRTLVAQGPQRIEKLDRINIERRARLRADAQALVIAGDAQDVGDAQRRGELGQLLRFRGLGQEQFKNGSAVVARGLRIGVEDDYLGAGYGAARGVGDDAGNAAEHGLGG